MENLMIIKKIKFKSLYSTDYIDNCSEKISLWFGIRLFFITAAAMVFLEFFRWPLISAKEDLPLIAMVFAQGLGIILYSFILMVLFTTFFAIILKSFGKTYIYELDHNCLCRKILFIKFIWPYKTESQIAELKYKEEHYIETLSPEELHNRRCNSITFMFLLLLLCFITTRLVFFGIGRYEWPPFLYPVCAVAFVISIILIIITIIKGLKKQIRLPEIIMWLSVAAPSIVMSIDMFCNNL